MNSAYRILFVLAALGLTACQSQVEFTELPFQKASFEFPSVNVPPHISDDDDPGDSEEPEIPPVVTEPEPVPEPLYIRNSGVCAADNSTAVTSCLKCHVPRAPTEEPPMSLKARQLMAIMTSACTIYNKSYGQPYTAPQQADHLAKLNRCTAALYKDSPPTSSQSNTLTRLLAADHALLSKMFGGVWYQPPYTDDFKTYFGIENYDAAKLFCLQNTSSFPTFVYPADYHEKSLNDPFYKLPQAYVLANQYREGLRTCMAESLRNPWSAGSVAPANSCAYETLQGESGVVINTQVSAWLAQGQQVSAEIKNVGLCLHVDRVETLQTYHGEVIVGTYSCK